MVISTRPKRVKNCIKNKSGPFLGSEFSFEDFSFQEVEKYEYQYIRDEEYEECYVMLLKNTLDPIQVIQNKLFGLILNTFDKENSYDRSLFT